MQTVGRGWRALLVALAVGLFIALATGLCGGGRPAYALDTGFRSPGASGAGSPTTCDTVGNAALSDDSYVVCDDGESFVLSGFGLAIPAGSTIDGIQVEIEHRTSLDWFTDETCITLSWDGGASYPSNQDCANTNADGAEPDDVDIVGAATDNWGHVWTVGEINGLYVRVEADSGLSTMSIDRIRVLVAYTPPAGTPTATPTATATAFGTATDTPAPTATATNTPTPASSGFLSPGASGAGSPTTCDTVGNAALSDDSYVVCDDGESFVLSGFGLAIPAGSTIDGIQIEIEHRTSLGWFTDETCITLSWDGGASYLSNLNCANTNADGADPDEIDIVGAVTDDWGHVWTVGEINGLYLRAEADSGFSTMSIDRIRVLVAYTPPTPTPTATPTATATATPTATPLTIQIPLAATVTLTPTPLPTAAPTALPPATPVTPETALPTSTPSPAATPTAAAAQALGDVDCNGASDSGDAMLILTWDVRLIAAPSCLAHADVNDDGVVNCVDAALLLQIEAGLVAAERFS